VIGVLEPWVAPLIALMVVVGATFALIGSFGLLRLPTFYQRVHPPTMGATLGVACTVAASILRFSSIESGLSLQPILIGVFAVVTTPVTYMLLVRAATRREGAIRDERVDEPTAHGLRSDAD
jgi:multicomponent K+:H+ antiporter subunit G